MNAARTYAKPKVSFGLNPLPIPILTNLQLVAAWKLDARTMNFVQWNRPKLPWNQPNLPWNHKIHVRNSTVKSVSVKRPTTKRSAVCMSLLVRRQAPASQRTTAMAFLGHATSETKL